MKLTGLAAALGSAMGARLGMAALNYGLFWELSHRLPAAELGGFSLLMNIFLLLQFLPLLGLSVPLIRRTATDRASSAVETSNALAFALPVAALFAAAVAASGWLGYPAALHLPFALVALSLLPTAWVIVAESVLVGSERVADMSRIQFFESLLRSGLAVLAVEYGLGLTGVFSVFLGARVCTAAAYWAHRHVPRPRPALVQRALQRRNLAEVPVYLGISVLVALGTRLDLIALSRLGGLEAAGVYAAASRLYEAAQMVPTLTVMVMLPTLARLFTAEPARFRELLALALRACLGFGMAIALAVAACAEPVIHLLYKPEMAGAVPVLRWLIFGAVLMTADQLLSSTMIAAQAQAQDLRSLVFGVAALALGLLLLVPWFGPAGAAAAVTGALFLRVAVRLRWAAEALQMPRLWADAARLAAATAAGLAGLAAVLADGADGGAVGAIGAASATGGWRVPLAMLAALAAFALGARLFGVIGPRPVQAMRLGFHRLTGRTA